jgi:hypothetical protein
MVVLLLVLARTLDALPRGGRLWFRWWLSRWFSWGSYSTGAGGRASACESWHLGS